MNVKREGIYFIIPSLESLKNFKELYQNIRIAPFIRCRSGKRL